MSPRLWFSGLLQDLRFACRQFRRRPGFAALATVTLALGIGGATAVYTVVHAVLLRTPLWDDPKSLLFVWDNAPRDGDQVRQSLASPADYREYLRATTLERPAFMRRTRPLLKYAGRSHRHWAGVATAGLFRETLRVNPILGRTFEPSDESGGCTVILSYSLWMSTFAADPSMPGRTLDLDNALCTVIGVMPAGFSLFPVDAQMWFLNGHAPASPRLTSFGAVLARLRPGVSMEEARAELLALHEVANRGRPADGDTGAVPLTPSIDSAQSELTFLTSPTLRASLWTTFGAAALLLGISWLNVAGLILARLGERQKELAVRAALGSGRMRLIRQALTEGLLLAVAAGLLGTVFAEAAVRWFHSMSPIALPPHAGQVRVDLTVLGFALVVTLTGMLVFSLLPAVQSSRWALNQKLKAASWERSRTARLCVAAEVALCFVLLIGSGLLLRSVLHLSSEPLGFDTTKFVSAGLELPAAAYREPQTRETLRMTLMERIQALPGVEAVIPAFVPPWDPNLNIVSTAVEVEGRGAPGTAFVEAGAATPGLFELTGTRLLSGRLFEPQDQAAPVAIISRRTADDHFPGESPLGRRIRFAEPDAGWLTIVGVVEDWKHLVRDAQWRDTPMIFTPAGSARNYFEISVKAVTDPALLIREIERQIAAVEPDADVTGPALLREKLNRGLAYPEFRAALLSSFAIGAMILAAVGLHGVLAQLVARRTAEFGVRRAVGAQTMDVLWLVARQGGRPVLAGLAAGMVGAWAAARWIQSMLFRVEPADAGVLAAASLSLLTAAVLGMAVPAWRAVRVDPVTVLRNE